MGTEAVTRQPAAVAFGPRRLPGLVVIKLVLLACAVLATLRFEGLL